MNLPMHDREYGALATVGVAVPQANPTVEPEMAALLPDKVTMLITRLQGSRESSKNRLVEYLDNFGASLAAFDTAPLDAVGYACTATSYLIGPDEEERRLADFSRKFGYPIVSTARAIREALAHLGARRIALFAPYPSWLIEASQRYWRTCGLTITDTATVPLDTSDTRHVYRVRTPMVLDSISQLDWRSADVVLMTGTGVPTLRAIAPVAARSGKPVLSSNLCLAWSLMRTLGVGDALPVPREGEFLFGGWSARLRA
jgi:maleate isomerase